MPPEGAVSNSSTLYPTWIDFRGNSTDHYFQSKPVLKLPVFQVPQIIYDMTVVTLIQRLRGVDDRWRKELERVRSQEFSAVLKNWHSTLSMHSTLTRFIVQRQCTKPRPIRQPCWRATRWRSRT